MGGVGVGGLCENLGLTMLVVPLYGGKVGTGAGVGLGGVGAPGILLNVTLGPVWWGGG